MESKREYEHNSKMEKKNYSRGRVHASSTIILEVKREVHSPKKKDEKGVNGGVKTPLEMWDLYKREIKRQ